MEKERQETREEHKALLTRRHRTRIGIALHGDDAELALLVGGINRDVVDAIGCDETELAHHNAAFICGSRERGINEQHFHYGIG